MKKIRFTLKAFAFLAFTLACASAAHAQATRTWVSGTGDDVNPCSRTAPCKTFAGAISKTADGGEIDAIDSAGYGAVTITKSITIDGNGQLASILNAGGVNAINVNDSNSGAPMTKVARIRNLSINGAGSGGTGINYTSGKAVYVENCVIFGNKFNASSHGINANLTADGGLLFVRDTIISENSGDGVRANTTSGTVRVICDGVRADRNVDGFEAVNNCSFHLLNSSASSNSGQGAQLENGTAANIDHSTFQSNQGSGIFAGPGGSVVRISDCTIVNNFVAGVNLSGGTVFTYGDNKIRGNGPTGTTDVSGGSLNGSTTKQ